MTTATLLNSYLYTEDYIIPLILCIPVPIYHLSLPRNVCSKMLSASIDCCVYSPTLHATFDHMKPTKHWSLKSNVNLIRKCHKLTHISFIKINMKQDPE